MAKAITERELHVECSPATAWLGEHPPPTATRSTSALTGSQRLRRTIESSLKVLSSPHAPHGISRSSFRSVIACRRPPLPALASGFPDRTPRTRSVSHPTCLDHRSDSVKILLFPESVRKDMGRTRPSSYQRTRARGSDWSECEGTRVLGIPARLSRRATAGKARLGGSLPHAPASRSDNRCTSA